MKWLSTSKFLHSLQIRTATWQHDTPDLYDYSVKPAIQSVLKAKTSSCVRYSVRACSLESLPGEQGTGEALAYAYALEDTYAVQPARGQEFWQVLRFSDQPNFPLSKGCVLRLGRVVLEVKDVLVHKESASALFHSAIAVSVPRRTDTCRICLCEDHTETNPLIAPCKCTGSMGFVHVDCLRPWLNSKVNLRETRHVSSFYYKDITCELCKEPLPSVVHLAGQTLCLYGRTCNNRPRLVLEERRRNVPTGIHLITLVEGEGVLVGRGNDCDLKLPDISVSRHHATLSFANKSFSVKDRKSKFGTLALQQLHLTLAVNQKVVVQVSKTVLSFTLKKQAKWCCLPTTKVVPTQAFALKSERSDEQEHLRQPDSFRLLSPRIELEGNSNAEAL